MTAKECFESAGYSYLETDEIIYYENHNGQKGMKVSFNKKDRSLIISGMKRYGWYLKDNLIVAINKQCEELGWIKE